MKKLLFILFSFSAFAQQSTVEEIKYTPRHSMTLLLGGTNRWVQQLPSRRDLVINYTELGLQYARETKPNVDVFGTLLYGLNGSRDRYASAGLGLRYYLRDRDKHKLKPFGQFAGEGLFDNNYNQTRSDVDFVGSIAAGIDYKVADHWLLRGMTQVGFPFFVSGTLDPFNHRGTNFSTTLGLVFEWGHEPIAEPVPDVIAAPLDTDGDGVLDSSDDCPTVKGVPENKGCPSDKDKDGVIDALDDCPLVAGLKELKGCPPANSVVAPITEVPVLAATPAAPTGPAAASAAPVPAARREVNLDSLFDTVVYFRTDKAWIGPMNARKLDRIIELLAEYPYVNVKLQGHTDYRQTERYNDGLAKRRVASVRRYLMQRGVKANRFKGEAFSELIPASNTDLQLNRRVEVHIWK
jgi:outer membrane protein OmpA-like peptidoglycan-associated protein